MEMYFEIITSRQYSDIEMIIINYDNVRPKGERLKTFGGFASGHTNLKTMFNKIDKILKGMPNGWRSIKPIDALDFAAIIAENVISGGVRRSALIVFTDEDEIDVIQAKSDLYTQSNNGEWLINNDIIHRSLSNNTVKYYEKPTKNKLDEHVNTMKNTGEPGFDNMEEALRRREDAVGFNPCFTGDTRLLTDKGFTPMIELVDKEFNIVSEDGTVSQGRVWYTGDKETIRLRLSDNTIIKCTPDHVFKDINGNDIEAKDLLDEKISPFISEYKQYDNDFIRYGFIQGDGNLSRLESKDHKGLEVYFNSDKDEDVLGLFGSSIHELKGNNSLYLNEGYKDKLIELGFDGKTLPYRQFPKSYDSWSHLQKASFLQGCYSANGSVITNHRVAYKTTSKAFADKLTNTLLQDFNIKAYITTNKAKEVEFSNGLYECKESYDVNIGRIHAIQTFHNEINFYQEYKKESLSNLIIHKLPYVMNITDNGVQPVYDFNEPVNHWGVIEGYIAHNCNEIILRDRGVCNLTEINMVAYVDDNGKIDYEGMYESQRMSALLGYRMATVELEIHKWDLVNKEDRLVGCSLTGLTDFMHKANLSYEDMRPILRKLREIATNEVNRLADELGMNRPKLVTTIKPSGTVSQLPTVSSGLHFNHSKHYIRRVRVNAEDPIAKALDESGFNWNPEVGQTEETHDTKVFEFPVEAPGNRFKDDIGAIEQLEWYVILMEEYVDHNASITVHVKDNEWDDVSDWLYNNWDDVLGVSFLPYDGGVYDLAPYEEISKKVYDEMVLNTPKFNTELVNRHEKFGEEFEVLDSSCDSGFCPIR